jgi:hypothetical protein
MLSWVTPAAVWATAAANESVTKRQGSEGHAELMANRVAKWIHMSCALSVLVMKSNRSIPTFVERSQYAGFSWLSDDGIPARISIIVTKDSVRGVSQPCQRLHCERLSKILL